MYGYSLVFLVVLVVGAVLADPGGHHSYHRRNYNHHGYRPSSYHHRQSYHHRPSYHHQYYKGYHHRPSYHHHQHVPEKVHVIREPVYIREPVIVKEKVFVPQPVVVREPVFVRQPVVVKEPVHVVQVVKEQVHHQPLHHIPAPVHHVPVAPVHHVPVAPVHHVPAPFPAPVIRPKVVVEPTVAVAHHPVAPLHHPVAPIHHPVAPLHHGGAVVVSSPHHVKATSAATQYHAQDELGQFRYGYANADSFKDEVRSYDGTVSGRYGYISPEGNKIQLAYTAGHDGFRAAGGHLPVPVHP